jgi:phage terminase large subunit-like protein
MSDAHADTDQPPLDRATLQEAHARCTRWLWRFETPEFATLFQDYDLTGDDVRALLAAVDALLKVRPASTEVAEQEIAAAAYEHGDNVHHDTWRLLSFRAGERHAFRELRLPLAKESE